MFCRPKKTGECVYVRHREKMFIPLGASLRACVNAGHCMGLMGAESGPPQALNPTWHLWHLRGYLLKDADLKVQGSGAWGTLVSFFPVSSCLPTHGPLSIAQIITASGNSQEAFCLPRILECNASWANQRFRDVKGTSIWVAIILRSEESRYSLGCILSLQGTHGAIGKTARAVLGYRYVLRARWCYANCRTIWCKSRVLTIPRFTDHREWACGHDTQDMV